MPDIYRLGDPGEPAPEPTEASQADLDLAIACLGEAEQIALVLRSGGVDVNACVRLSDSVAGTPLMLVKDPDAAWLLIVLGAEVNSLYWGQGPDTPPVTALDSALQSLESARDPYLSLRPGALVDLLREHGALTGAELSQRGQVPVKPADSPLARPTQPSLAIEERAADMIRHTIAGLSDSTAGSSESRDLPWVEVPAPGERPQAVEELLQRADHPNPARRVLALCELSTLDQAGSADQKKAWITRALAIDPVLAEIALRYQRVGVVVTWELLIQAKADAERRLDLLTARRDGELGDREFAARAYLTLTVASLYGQRNASDQLACALHQVKGVEIFWRNGGFSDISSVAADDGECTALRVLEAPDSVDFSAVEPGSLWGDSNQARAAAVAASCLEATRGLWVNQTFVLRQPLPSDVTSPELREKWATALAGLRAARRPGCPDEERRAAEVAFNVVTATVRSQPGHERFLAPPSAADLMFAVGETGAAVYLICPRPWMSVVSGASSAWAVVVTREAISAVRLPQANDTVLRKAHDAYTYASEHGTDSAQLQIIEVLGWLNDAILKPIEPLLAGKQRLWWIPTGSFVGLPLSAASLVTTSASTSIDLDRLSGFVTRGAAGAEVHDGGAPGTQWQGTCSPPAAFTGRIPRVQSIVATMASVASLQGVELGESSRRQIAVLGVPETKVRGWWPLAQVEAELEAVTQTWQDGDQTLPVTRVLPARREELRAAMASSDLLHFAGHATTEELVCFDEAVSLVELVQSARTGDFGIRAGYLAVLSACLSQGRAAANLEFPVAVAVQLAAFSHVIGSVVPVFDDAAIAFSRTLHGHLRAAGDRPDPAVAMSATVTDLRDKYPNQPAYWAGWVHTGP